MAVVVTPAETVFGVLHPDLATLVAATAEAHPELLAHLESTRDLAERLIEPFGLRGADARLFTLAAYLHDIGKMMLPPSILWKADALSTDDRRIIEAHPRFGARLIEAADPRIATVVGQHHERVDASQIHPLARALAVVDAYVVMTTDRSYQARRSSAEALVELRRCAGTQFDSYFVDAFIEAQGGA